MFFFFQMFWRLSSIDVTKRSMIRACRELAKAWPTDWNQVILSTTTPWQSR